ncbi:MAG: hypothetical protein CSA72_02485 [Rhodobacterales bacterium]|nr:MAG: hypothetical protein CSA72_02485 [Rhodobacterales bacterium]
MRSLLIAASLTVAPVLCAANDIEVSGGQHDGFVRLFLAPSARNGAWDSDGESGQIIITHSAPGARYDLSATFARIGTDVVTNVTNGGSGRLVIATACDCAHRLVTRSDGSAYVDILEDIAEDHPSRVRPRLRPVSQLAAEAAAPEPALPSPDVLSEISEMERTLRASITTGIEQRLLLGAVSREDPVLEDREAVEKGSREDICFPAEMYSFLDEHSAPQANTSGSTTFDVLEGMPSDTALIAMSRDEIRSGRGFEARAIARAVAEPSVEAAFLTSLASIIEDVDAPQAMRQHCRGNSLLWSQLADPKPSNLTEPDAKSLFEATLLLPRPILSLIAPRVVALLADAQFKDLSQQLRASAPSKALAFEGAMWAASSVELEADQTTRSADKSSEDLAFPLSDSLAYENRSSNRGKAVETDRFDALLEHGDYAAAREVLDRSTPTEGAPIARISRLANAVTRDADDTTFLTYSFELTPDELNIRARDKVAARLDTLGFHTQSNEWRGTAPVIVAEPTPEPAFTAGVQLESVSPDTAISRAHDALAAAERVRIDAFSVLEQ